MTRAKCRASPDGSSRLHLMITRRYPRRRSCRGAVASAAAGPPCPTRAALGGTYGRRAGGVRTVATSLSSVSLASSVSLGSSSSSGGSAPCSVSRTLITRFLPRSSSSTRKLCPASPRNVSLPPLARIGWPSMVILARFGSMATSPLIHAGTGAAAMGAGGFGVVGGPRRRRRHGLGLARQQRWRRGQCLGLKVEIVGDDAA